MNETLTKNGFKAMSNAALVDVLARMVWDNLDAGSIESDLIEEVTRRVLFPTKITVDTHCQVQCRDLECESRSFCEHSEPHDEYAECQFCCGADEPRSRCYPVEVA